MSNQICRDIYCVDTSALVTVQRLYRYAVFPGVWDGLDDLARDGRLASPREVLRELEQGSEDHIYRWAKQREFIFRDLDQEQIEVARKIVNDPNYRGLFDFDKEIPEADPFVIALAIVEQAKNRMFGEHWIVTADEGSRRPGKRPRIPEVCNDHRYKVDCIKTLDMFEREGWRLLRAGDSEPARRTAMP